MVLFDRPVPISVPVADNHHSVPYICNSTSNHALPRLARQGLCSDCCLETSVPLAVSFPILLDSSEGHLA